MSPLYWTVSCLSLLITRTQTPTDRLTAADSSEFKRRQEIKKHIIVTDVINSIRDQKKSYNELM